MPTASNNGEFEMPLPVKNDASILRKGGIESGET
jgi:hypothetical protein